MTNKRIVLDFGHCPQCGARLAVIDTSDPWEGGYLSQGVGIILGCQRCSAETAEQTIEVVSAWFDENYPATESELQQ